MILLAAALALAASCSDDGGSKKAAWFFDERVAPIIVKSCLKCHNHELDDGDVSFENRKSLIAERKGRGAAIVPGKPEDSALVRAIRHDGDTQMPPGKKLPDAEIGILIDWIRRCAPWGTKLRGEN